MTMASNVSRPLRKNLSQAVAEELLRHIQRGDLAPGERAPTEKDLMEMFAIGRNTAREATQSLVAMGVLDVRPGRGAIVLRTPDASALDQSVVSSLLGDQTVADLYEFRLLVESDIAGLAAERATPESNADIARALAEYRRCVRSNVATYDADIEFHRAVARASANAVFSTVLNALTEQLTRLRQATDAIPGAREIAVLGHTRIAEAIAVGDADRARAEMRDHVLTALEALKTAQALGTIDHLESVS